MAKHKLDTKERLSKYNPEPFFAELSDNELIVQADKTALLSLVHDGFLLNQLDSFEQAVKSGATNPKSDVSPIIKATYKGVLDAMANNHISDFFAIENNTQENPIEIKVDTWQNRPDTITTANNPAGLRGTDLCIYFSWNYSLLKGTDGTDGTDGVDGTDGTNGTDGKVNPPLPRPGIPDLPNPPDTTDLGGGLIKTCWDTTTVTTLDFTLYEKYPELDFFGLFLGYFTETDFDLKPVIDSFLSKSIMNYKPAWLKSVTLQIYGYAELKWHGTDVINLVDLPIIDSITRDFTPLEVNEDLVDYNTHTQGIPIPFSSDYAEYKVDDYEVADASNGVKITYNFWQYKMRVLVICLRCATLQLPNAPVYTCTQAQTTLATCAPNNPIIWQLYERQDIPFGHSGFSTWTGYYLLYNEIPDKNWTWDDHHQAIYCPVSGRYRITAIVMSAGYENGYRALDLHLSCTTFGNDMTSSWTLTFSPSAWAGTITKEGFLPAGYYFPAAWVGPGSNQTWGLNYYKIEYLG